MTVIDASATVRLLLAWPDDKALRSRFADLSEVFHAPGHIDAEVVSAIIGLLKGSKIEEDRARRMISQYRDLRIRRHATARLGSRLIELRHNFTTYDAAYVALAEQLRQPLLTSDAKFGRAPSVCHSAEIHTVPL